MDTLNGHLLPSLGKEGSKQEYMYNELMDTSMDENRTADSLDPTSPIPRSSTAYAKHSSDGSHNHDHDSNSNSRIDLASFPLPPEVLLCILENLTVSQLLPCQLVSRHFRAVTRTVMLDKLGDQLLRRQQQQQQDQQCLQCQQRQYQQQQEQEQQHSLWPADGNGLPPLPQNHYSNNSLQQTTPSLLTSAPHQYTHTHGPQGPQQPQHHLHHHLYQQQATDGWAQHHQTDLHLSQNSQESNIYEPQSSEPLYGYSSKLRRRDGSYTPPGAIALFLFPDGRHTSARWQIHQSVYFRCTSVDRAREQLVFSPISPGSEDWLKFNTNSWNIPSNPSLLGSSGNSDNGSRNDSRATGSLFKSPATGLDLFDYSTGKPRGKRGIDPVSYAFSNQFARTTTSHKSNSSDIESSTSTSTSSLELSEVSSSPSDTPAANLSQSSSLPSTLTNAYFANTDGDGDELHSVIGIKHGDWPEDRQSEGQWLQGGIYSRQSQQAMVLLPWMVTHSCEQESTNGQTVDKSRNLIRRQDQGKGRNDQYLLQQQQHGTEASLTVIDSDRRQYGHREGSGADEDNSTKVHMHLLQQNSIRARIPPPHHQRFFCLHHDQLMTGTAAPNSSAATALASGLISHGSANPGNRIGRGPVITVGSKHLAVDYKATVMDCHRCLFCVTSPCKTNLEIKIKFYQLRVSLDWILSGFVPDQGQHPQPQPQPQPQHQHQHQLKI